MRILFNFMALLMVIACGKSLELKQSDSGRTITLNKGQTAVIKLSENPTTGYNWEFEIEPKKQKVITVISSKFVPATSDLIGAGGVKEYKFKAKNKGQITLSGYYARPWEELNKETALQVHYEISVE